ncbi:MAG: tape measure protein [Bacteroidota bacterium]
MSGKLVKIGMKGKSAFHKIEPAHKGFNRRLDRTNTKLNTTNFGLKRLVGLASRFGIAFGFAEATRGAIRLGTEFEQTRISYETMLGSAEKGNRLINRLFDFANRSPFDFRTVSGAADTLLGFGVANEKILPALRMVGDVSRGNRERFKLMTLAYAQMQAAGKLMGQDLLQMINAGFNPLLYIAEETGKSLPELRKEMERGAISTAMVERAFARATSQGGRFYKFLEKQTGTVAGKWQIFTGKVQIFTAQWMQKLMPALGRFLDWGIKVVDFLPKLPQYFNAFLTTLERSNPVFSFLLNNIELVKTGLVGFSAAWLTYKTIMGVVGIATKVYTGIQWALNAAMAANPLGLLLVGLAALAAMFVYAYNRVGWFRGMVDGSWTSLKGFAMAIKDLVINRIQEMLSGLSSMAKGIKHFFAGEWTKAWEEGKKARKGIFGVDGPAITKFKADLKKSGEESLSAFAKGMATVEKNKRKGSFLDQLKSKGSSLLGGSLLGATTSPSGNGDLSALTNGINAINAGGRRQTNITVNFDKLVENFTVSSQNITQGFAETEEELKRMLLRVLNSTNQLQTSPT